MNYDLKYIYFKWRGYIYTFDNTHNIELHIKFPKLSSRKARKKI